MPLSLPNITLVLIDTIAEELANEAINDTLERVKPKEIRIFTGQPRKFRERESTIKVDTHNMVNSLQSYNRFLWWEVPKYITTSHMLIIQWDGWVINPEAWTEEFLSFDYIGALWPWHKENRVGNGGFSLRSTELMQYLSKKHYQPGTHEDDVLCRTYKNELLDLGCFSWAPEELAKKFSCEHPIITDPTGYYFKSFGFHDCRNWPAFLNPTQLAIRLDLCDRNPYISQKKEYKELKRQLEWTMRTRTRT